MQYTLIVPHPTSEGLSTICQNFIKNIKIYLTPAFIIMFWVLAAVPFFHSLFSGSALSQSTPNRSIEWFPCTLDTEGTPSTCGTLAVPLDYTEQGSERLLNLSLIKVNATKKPFKGSIMFNPGGPGYPVRSILAGRSGEFFLK